MAKFKSGDYIKHNNHPYWYLIMAVGKDYYYMLKYPGSINTEWDKTHMEKYCTLVGRNLQGAI